MKLGGVIGMATLLILFSLWSQLPSGNGYSAQVSLENLVYGAVATGCLGIGPGIKQIGSFSQRQQRALTIPHVGLLLCLLHEAVVVIYQKCPQDPCVISSNPQNIPEENTLPVST